MNKNERQSWLHPTRKTLIILLVLGLSVSLMYLASECVCVIPAPRRLVDNSGRKAEFKYGTSESLKELLAVYKNHNPQTKWQGVKPITNREYSILHQKMESARPLPKDFPKTNDARVEAIRRKKQKSKQLEEKLVKKLRKRRKEIKRAEEIRKMKKQLACDLLGDNYQNELVKPPVRRTKLRSTGNTKMLRPERSARAVATKPKIRKSKRISPSGRMNSTARRILTEERLREMEMNFNTKNTKSAQKKQIRRKTKLKKKQGDSMSPKRKTRLKLVRKNGNTDCQPSN